jgi:hypothetical protein
VRGATVFHAEIKAAALMTQDGLLSLLTVKSCQVHGVLVYWVAQHSHFCTVYKRITAFSKENFCSFYNVQKDSTSS